MTKNQLKPIKNPAYARVRQGLMDRIQQGKLRVGDKIPSELALTKMHRLSRDTIRHALSLLVNEGYLVRTPGRGTFVANHRSIRFVRAYHWAYLCRYSYPGDCILQGLNDFAQRENAALQVELIGDSRTQLESVFNRLLTTQKIDGIIVEPPPYEKNMADIYNLPARAHIPLVFMSTTVMDSPHPVVQIDHECVGRQIAQCLIDLGHRRIGYVSSPRYCVPDQHLKGIRHTLQKHGLSLEDSYILFERSFSPARGFDTTRRLLELPHPPTALVTLNDVTAANAYLAIKAAHLRIPDDISVVAAAITQPHMVDSLDPPLTTWCGPESSIRLGVKAGEVLLDIIEGRLSPQNLTFLIPPSPLPRGSLSKTPPAP